MRIIMGVIPLGMDGGQRLEFELGGSRDGNGGYGEEVSVLRLEPVRCLIQRRVS
jgi:hypothetical protein